MSTRTNSSRLHRQPTITVESALEEVKAGSYFYKVRSSSKYLRRKYHVDVDNMRLFFTPTQRKYWVCKTLPYVDLSDAVEARRGRNSDRFNVIETKIRKLIDGGLLENPQQYFPQEEKCFSIIFENKSKTIDLVADDKRTRNIWLRAVNYLIASWNNVDKEFAYDAWVKEQFKKADKKGNGSLTFKECQALIKSLNIAMDKQQLKTLFHAADFRKLNQSGEAALDVEEFQKFFLSLNSRPELEKIFHEYTANNSSVMGPEELRRFLFESQKETPTLEQCSAMIEKFEPNQGKHDGFLSLRGFQEMLVSKEHDIFNKEHREVYQDMSQPLSHYFIASSHNTYLLGDQLIGNSSIEAYIRVLLQGCRCIELDVWDGDNGEPIIYHGYTLTSKILLRDVIEAIRYNAFKTSSYPVILSIENHLSLDQQVSMAIYFEAILGDYLHREPLSKDESQWPSPDSEELREKILIKGKKLSEILESNEEMHRRNVETPVVPGAMAFPEAGPLSGPLKKVKVMNRRDYTDDGGDHDLILPNEEELDLTPEPISSPTLPVVSLSAQKSIKKKLPSIAPELSDLITYCKARKFNSFDECLEWKFYEMASFSEKKGEELIESDIERFIEYNKTHLARVYPKGTRTNSSNYSPLRYWSAGCQLVALNYQTWDKALRVNEALFAQNGRCGYVLKPAHLRAAGSARVAEQEAWLVKIRVISGQTIPKAGQGDGGEVVDPYVVVKVYGHPNEKQKKKSNPVKNNGFNPTWDAHFEFRIACPQLAFLEFVVKDQSSSGTNWKLGHFILPASSISEGYRHVHLQDNNGQEVVPASLFVHVTIDKCIASLPPTESHL